MLIAIGIGGAALLPRIFRRRPSDTSSNRDDNARAVSHGGVADG